jgi:hypothetical protein
MAARLREHTGINDLTVNQTVFRSPNVGYVVCDSSSLHMSDPTVIYIGVPKPSFTGGRPNWRLEQGDKFVEIPKSLSRPDEPAIYEARLASEPDTAAPMDRILVRPGEDLPLPSGRYRESAFTLKSGWSADIPLTVDE